MKNRTWMISLILVLAGSWSAATEKVQGNQLKASVGDMVMVVNGGGEGSVSFIDPDTDTALGPFGPLGMVGTTQLVDGVLTPDGNTAIVSDVTNRLLHFLDLRPMPPVPLGSVMLPIFPLDLDLSPNGRFVVATGGGGNTNVVSVDVASRMIVNNLALRNNGQAQAVAVAPDGETVLAADFMGAQVHLLRLGPDGMLTQPLTVGSIPVDGRPNNIAISGRTAVVSITTTPDGMMNSLAVTILRIDGPLRVVRAGTVAGLPGFQQGAAFTPDGRRVLVLSLAPAPDQVSELRVDGPGMVSDTGRRVNLRSNMTGFFGMDAIGVVPDQSKAYVGNTGFNVLLSGVTVIDLTRMEITDIIRTPIPFGIVVPRPQ